MTNVVSYTPKKQPAIPTARGIITNINILCPKKKELVDVFRPNMCVAIPDSLNIYKDEKYEASLNHNDIASVTDQQTTKLYKYYNSEDFLAPTNLQGIKNYPSIESENDKNYAIELLVKYGALRRVVRDETGKILLDNTLQTFIDELNTTNILFYNTEDNTFDKFKIEDLNILLKPKAFDAYSKKLKDLIKSGGADNLENFNSLYNFLNGATGVIISQIIPHFEVWQQCFSFVNSLAYFDRNLSELNDSYLLNLNFPKIPKTEYTNIGDTLLYRVKDVPLILKYGKNGEEKTIEKKHPYNVLIREPKLNKLVTPPKITWSQKSYNFAEFLHIGECKNKIREDDLSNAIKNLVDNHKRLRNYYTFYNLYKIDGLRLICGDDFIDLNLSYDKFKKLDITQFEIHEFEKQNSSVKLSVIFNLSVVRGAEVIFYGDILPEPTGFYPNVNPYGYSPRITFNPCVAKLKYFGGIGDSTFISEDMVADAAEQMVFEEIDAEEEAAIMEQLMQQENNSVPQIADSSTKIEDAIVEEPASVVIDKKISDTTKKKLTKF